MLMPAQGFIFGKLKAQLKDKVGIALDDIESVIITHGYPDHIGALDVSLRKIPQLRLLPIRNGQRLQRISSPMTQPIKSITIP